MKAIYALVLGVAVILLVALGAYYLKPGNVPSDNGADVFTMEYGGEEYSFSLDFPEIWDGYETMQEGDVIYFGFDSQPDIMAVSILPRSEYDQALEEPGPIGTLLGSEGSVVFLGSGAQDYADEFTSQRRMEVVEILATFEVVN